MICMMCGKSAEWRESEPDRYHEYSNDGSAYVAWVYCAECDCWTQHQEPA